MKEDTDGTVGNVQREKKSETGWKIRNIGDVPEICWYRTRLILSVSGGYICLGVVRGRIDSKEWYHSLNYVRPLSFVHLCSMYESRGLCVAEPCNFAWVYAGKKFGSGPRSM